MWANKINHQKPAVKTMILDSKHYAGSQQAVTKCVSFTRYQIDQIGIFSLQLHNKGANAQVGLL